MHTSKPSLHTTWVPHRLERPSRCSRLSITPRGLGSGLLVEDLHGLLEFDLLAADRSPGKETTSACPLVKPGLLNFSGQCIPYDFFVVHHCHHLQRSQQGSPLEARSHRAFLPVIVGTVRCHNVMVHGLSSITMCHACHNLGAKNVLYRTFRITFFDSKKLLFEVFFSIFSI